MPRAPGIGHEIVTWGENFKMPRLLAGVVLIAVAAVAVNEAIRWLERGGSAWRDHDRRRGGIAGATGLSPHLCRAATGTVPALADIGFAAAPAASSCWSAPAAAASPRC